jgi:hypothetical protein
MNKAGIQADVILNQRSQQQQQVQHHNNNEKENLNEISHHSGKASSKKDQSFVK